MLYSNYLRDKSQNAIKIKEIEGVPSILKHSKGKDIKKYEIYGNNIQDGTPTPDTPIEIQSVGDLVIDTASEHYGKYEVPVKVSGKNLFKYASDERANAPLVEDVFDEDGNKIGAVLQGNSSSTSGTPSFANGWFRPGYNVANDSICPKLYPGQTVTVSVDYKILEANENFSGTVELYLFGRNTDASYTTGMKSVTAGKQYRLSHTYTIKTKAAYEWYPVVTLNSCKVEVKNFQIEFGTANTDYEPYQEPVTEHIYLDEPLRKIGDCADYIDYNNRKVVRNTKKVTFDGTENWAKETLSGKEYSNFYIATNPISKARTKVLSNRFISNASSATGTENNAFISYSTKLNITYATDTVENWKTQLSAWDTGGNPLTVHYILAAPTEESISLSALKTFKGTSIMSVDTTIQPSNIKTKYVRL